MLDKFDEHTGQHYGTDDVLIVLSTSIIISSSQSFQNAFVFTFTCEDASAARNKLLTREARGKLAIHFEMRCIESPEGALQRGLLCRLTKMGEDLPEEL